MISASFPAAFVRSKVAAVMSTPDVCALKAANRQWSNLDAEMTREIGKLKFIHPTALLIKDLKFRFTLPDQLTVVRMKRDSADYFLLSSGGYRGHSFHCRTFLLADGFDVLQAHSNRESGFVLGWVVEDEE